MKTIKIDLNGHTITSSQAITIKNNLKDSKVIITDTSADKSGKIINTNGGVDSGIVLWARLGDIEINEGTFENNSVYEATAYVGTVDSKLDGANPKITINGGKFINNAEGEYAYKSGVKPLNLNVINNLTPNNIVVKGGFFNNQDPAEGDDKLGGTFVAEGYESIEVIGGYEVVEK